MPQSHTYNEDKIIRTNKGANFNQYKVRLIKSWGGKNKLIRVPINYGQILVFSSHLVHGLALNNEQNKTRISLEFRLFKKNQD